MYQLQTISMVLLVAQYTVTYSMPIQTSSKRDVTDGDDINNLRESITALGTIQLVLQSTIPALDIQDILSELSQLYKIQDDIQSLNQTLMATTSELEALEILTELALNQTCAWVNSVINIDNFICSRSEIMLLDLKLRLANVTESTKSSLSSRDINNDYYNTCEWLRDNIYCTDQPATIKVQEYFEEKELLVYCKRYYKC